MLEFCFLGTSSGTPTKTRNVTALALHHINNHKSWLLMDCGESTQQQILRTPYSLVTLAAICISHVHGDHCYGLPGLLATASLLGRRAPLILIAPAEILVWINHTFALTDSKINFEINFFDSQTYWETHDVINIQNIFNIHIRKLSHRVPSFAYEIICPEKKPKLNVQKLEKDQIPRGTRWQEIQNAAPDSPEAAYWLPPSLPLRVMVGGDNDTPDLLLPYLTPETVLIHETTYTADIAQKVGPTPQHSCAKRVALTAQKAGLRDVILTHFSARYTHDVPKLGVQPLFEEARQYFTGNIWLAEDFARFRLDKNGLARV